MQPPASILGLEPCKVRLVDSSPHFARLYAEEEHRLRPAISPLVVAIEHFGSTSIDGLKTKPIIDILVGLRSFDHGRQLVEPLAFLGYDYVGTEMVPDDHLFGLGNPRTHLLHAVVHGGHNWTRNLRFRDRLRDDPAIAAQYEQLKIELAAKFPDSRADYTAAKQLFIDSIADS
jgi:GrpB-like predicted nucleotidyltransferase (UPF0157 family)